MEWIIAVVVVLALIGALLVRSHLVRKREAQVMRDIAAQAGAKPFSAPPGPFPPRQGPPDPVGERPGPPESEPSEPPFR
jgi:hypothetical protein